jgi:hypothetical protein
MEIWEYSIESSFEDTRRNHLWINIILKELEELQERARGFIEAHPGPAN